MGYYYLQPNGPWPKKRDYNNTKNKTKQKTQYYCRLLFWKSAGEQLLLQNFLISHKNTYKLKDLETSHKKVENLDL